MRLSGAQQGKKLCRCAMSSTAGWENAAGSRGLGSGLTEEKKSVQYSG